VDEAAFFREHGWVTLRGVIDGGRAGELSLELDRIFPEARLPSDRVHERTGVSAMSPLLRRQVCDPALGPRIAALLGCARVQLLQDTALIKPPETEARVEWHQDHTYTGFIEETVSVRFALTDCTIESGCLRVLDKSHRHGFRSDLRALRAVAVTDDSHHMPDGEVIPVELQAGDASVHHCLTFHSSEPNRSAWPRRTLIARMFDATLKLQREKLPPGLEIYFPTAPDGRLAESAFPLL
jgi:ectoine hydroxylase-related dioxygenase (phytanoyl-CoA dioxygenase family)